MVPKELEKLELYAADERLCNQWDELYYHWKETYPQLDIMAQVKAAHEWEWVRPPTIRKKNRKRFIGTWLSKAYYRLPAAIRNRPQSSQERIALIDKIKRWGRCRLWNCVWEVRSYGLWLVEGHSGTGARPWNDIATWELKDARRVERSRVQKDDQKAPEILPLPEI